MFIRYRNTLYHLIQFLGKEMITTYDKQKTDDSFYLVSDYYAKDYNPQDDEIQDVYEADFYVVYHDASETVKEAMKYAYEGSGMLACDQRAVKEGIWCVNEGIPRHCTPKIENDEVGINLGQLSYSDDWVQFDRSSISKIVNIYECSRLMVRYAYTVKNGCRLAEKEIVEVDFEPEAFKEEMLKHRIGNI